MILSLVKSVSFFKKQQLFLNLNNGFHKFSTAKMVFFSVKSSANETIKDSHHKNQNEIVVSKH